MKRTREELTKYIDHVIKDIHEDCNKTKNREEINYSNDLLLVAFKIKELLVSSSP